MMTTHLDWYLEAVKLREDCDKLYNLIRRSNTQEHSKAVERVFKKGYMTVQDREEFRRMES